VINKLTYLSRRSLLCLAPHPTQRPGKSNPGVRDRTLRRGAQPPSVTLYNLDELGDRLFVAVSSRARPGASDRGASSGGESRVTRRRRVARGSVCTLSKFMTQPVGIPSSSRSAPTPRRARAASGSSRHDNRSDPVGDRVTGQHPGRGDRHTGKCCATGTPCPPMERPFMRRSR
jgi:hypothetical protein